MKQKQFQTISCPICLEPFDANDHDHDTVNTGDNMTILTTSTSTINSIINDDIDDNATRHETKNKISTTTNKKLPRVDSYGIPLFGPDNKKIKYLRCGHIFCESCWKNWVHSGHGNPCICPVCRQDVGKISSKSKRRRRRERRLAAVEAEGVTTSREEEEIPLLSSSSPPPARDEEHQQYDEDEDNDEELAERIDNAGLPLEDIDNDAFLLAFSSYGSFSSTPPMPAIIPPPRYRSIDGGVRMINDNSRRHRNNSERERQDYILQPSPFAANDDDNSSDTSNGVFSLRAHLWASTFGGSRGATVTAATSSRNNNSSPSEQIIEGDEELDQHDHNQDLFGHQQDAGYESIGNDTDDAQRSAEVPTTHLNSHAEEEGVEQQHHATTTRFWFPGRISITR